MIERILEPRTFRRTPWKNGGGFTTEIFAERDPGQDDFDFAWRVSIAEVHASGTFSRFPSADRLIMQLAGPDLELSHPGTPRPSIQLRQFMPYVFSGDWDTVASLARTDAVALDFNLIVRRERAFGALAAFTAADLQSEEWHLKMLGEHMGSDIRIVLYAYSGGFHIGKQAIEPGHAYFWSGPTIPRMPMIHIAAGCHVIAAMVALRSRT